MTRVLAVAAAGADQPTATTAKIKTASHTEFLTVPAADSKYSLLRHIRDRIPHSEAIPLGHCVVFPDVSLDDRIGLYGPRDLIVDKNDLRQSAIAVDRLCRHWELACHLPQVTITALINDLAPTVAVRPCLRDIANESEAQIIHLTNQQISVFHQLRRMRRIAVLGGAGTGKTVLAVERARQLSAECSTLLVCYNEPLAQHLSAICSGTPNLEVATFHQLCFRAARKLGVIPESPDSDWWEHSAPEVLARGAAGRTEPVGALVVDEVQDFAENWLTALLMLLSHPDNSPCYLFGDNHQHLYRKVASLPEQFPQYTLDTNCRNTLPIAKRVADVFGDAVPTSGPSGQSPRFISAADITQAVETVQDLCVNLLEQERIPMTQIVVLTTESRVRDILRTRLAGEIPFVGMQEHGIIVESVFRFKGLEAMTVVLVVSDGIIGDETANAMLYVGLSRARSVLFVVGSKRVRRAVGWGDS